MTDLHDHVVKTLAIVVLTRVEESRFRLTTSSSWVCELLPDLEVGATLDVAEHFPAIEAFLPDAELAWSCGAHTVRRSEIWIEQGSGDIELPLQAVAMRYGEERILLIEIPWVRYLEKLRILTRARETKLEQERLFKEIQKKEVFLHCIIHDLAGPLTATLGALSLLEKKPLDDASRRLVDLCQRVSEDQERVIRTVLEGFWAELASPKTVTLETDEIPDGLEVMGRVRDDLEPSFSNRGVALQVTSSVADSGARRVMIDRDSLARMLYNLAENALRHSPLGSVVLMRLDRERDRLRFTVEDEGPGVAPTQREQLFERFARGGSHTGKVGLGLYFCRITAERWGGEILHENVPEGGSRFAFHLPAA